MEGGLALGTPTFMMILSRFLSFSQSIVTVPYGQLTACSSGMFFALDRSGADRRVVVPRQLGSVAVRTAGSFYLVLPQHEGCRWPIFPGKLSVRRFWKSAAGFASRMY